MTSSFISDSQKQFIISSIKNDFRIDGRSNTDPQKVIIKINNLDHLLGSCLLNIHSSQNEVHIYTGIKLRVEKRQLNKTQKSSTVQPNNTRQRISLQLGCIKKLSVQQQQTRLYIEQYLNKYVIETHLQQFQALMMIPQAKRHFLTLSIQTYILSTPHISYLEHLYTCIKLALQTIDLPKFCISFNEITDEEVIDVQARQIDVQARQRQEGTHQRKITPKSHYKGLQGLKIVGVLTQNYVLGMTAEEYEAVDSCVLVAIDTEKRVVGFQSLKGTLKVEQLHQIIKFAKC